MLTNYTKLADLYAVAKAEVEAAAARMEALRMQVLETGEAELIGDAFALKVSRFDQSRLSTELARKYLTPSQIAKCTTTTPSARITPKAAAPSLTAIETQKATKPGRKAKGEARATLQ